MLRIGIGLPCCHPPHERKRHDVLEKTFVVLLVCSSRMHDPPLEFFPSAKRFVLPTQGISAMNGRTGPLQGLAKAPALAFLGWHVLVVAGCLGPGNSRTVGLGAPARRVPRAGGRDRSRSDRDVVVGELGRKNGMA